MRSFYVDAISILRRKNDVFSAGTVAGSLLPSPAIDVAR